MGDISNRKLAPNFFKIRQRMISTAKFSVHYTVALSIEYKSQKIIFSMYILARHIKIIDNCGRSQYAFATVFGLIEISGKYGTRMLHPHAWF